MQTVQKRYDSIFPKYRVYQAGEVVYPEIANIIVIIVIHDILEGNA